jgi:hypothetical protein
VRMNTTRYQTLFQFKNKLKIDTDILPFLLRRQEAWRRTRHPSEIAKTLIASRVNFGSKLTKSSPSTTSSGRATTIIRASNAPAFVDAPDTHTGRALLSLKSPHQRR